MEFEPEIAVRLVWAGVRVVRCRRASSAGRAVHFSFSRDYPLLASLYLRLLAHAGPRVARCGSRQPGERLAAALEAAAPGGADAPARRVERTTTSTRCARYCPPRALQDDAGCVPSWIAIEYMAQCAAAHGGLLARARGAAPRLGLFVGSRRLLFRCERFAPDAVLRVSVRHAAGHGDSLAFDCSVEVRPGPPLAEGRLNVLLLGGLPGTNA
jgi:predicted hotdog family 3-hydroxylacyl-ACP dehydratase